MGLITQVAARLAFAVALVFTCSLIIFFCQSFAKDSLVSTVLAGQSATPEKVAAVRAEYGLDDPFLVRYGSWLADALQGDLGQSIKSNDAVTTLIMERLPVTLQLTGMAMLFILTIGVPLGMLAGSRAGKATDRGVTLASLIGMSTPPFATGVLLLYVFGVEFGWFPVYGAGTPEFLDRLQHLTLPALAIAGSMTAIVVRQTRAVTMGMRDQDHVVFARARGLSPGVIWLRYSLRGIAFPVLTVAGLVTISLVGGSILVEQVFSIEGLGRLILTSVWDSDVDVVQGVALVFTVAVVLINLTVDILGWIVDPRTRQGSRR